MFSRNLKFCRITQSALPGKKNRNCDYAPVFEATSPKLTGVGPWTLYHRLGPPSGCEKPILRVFDDIMRFRRLRLSTITTFRQLRVSTKMRRKTSPEPQTRRKFHRWYYNTDLRSVEVVALWSRSRWDFYRRFWGFEIIERNRCTSWWERSDP